MIGCRSLPHPDLTIHAPGDIHVATSGGISANRQAILQAAFAKVTLPDVAATIHTGDCTTNGTTAEDALFSAFIASLGLNVSNFHLVPGNHDIQGNLRSVSAAETSLGMAQTPWAVDLGFVAAIGFFPGDDYFADNSGSIFTDANLNALDALIGAQTNPVWLFNHFPLHNTVGVAADPALSYRSIDSAFYASTHANTADSSGVLAMLAEHDNVKAWICGHTHSNLATDGLVMTVAAGTTRSPRSTPPRWPPSTRRRRSLVTPSAR